MMEPYLKGIFKEGALKESSTDGNSLNFEQIGVF